MERSQLAKPDQIVLRSLRNRSLSVAFILAILLTTLSPYLRAQQPATLPEAPSATQTSASISGVVLDINEGLVPDAHVTLTNKAGTEERATTSLSDGTFLFSNLPLGTYEIHISSPGLENFISDPIVLRPDEHYQLPRIALPIASANQTVQVTVTEDQIATEQVHELLQQRAFGVFPNFYTSYNWNPAPLKTKHKFYLALRSTIDPVNFLTTAAVAGVQQYRGTYAGFGDGPEGYGKRYGADFGNIVVGRFIGGAILPSLFHQDPRYFYQGTGSVFSRSRHAIASTYITRGDNGHTQPNVSYLLGISAAAAITNLWYPDNDRTAVTVVENVLIRIGTHGISNLVREFISRKITTKVPTYAKGKRQQ